MNPAAEDALPGAKAAGDASVAYTDHISLLSASNIPKACTAAKKYMVPKPRRTLVRVGPRLKFLRGVSLSIVHREFVATVGASGSGKLTFMNTLGCPDRFTNDRGPRLVRGADTWGCVAPLPGSVFAEWVFDTNARNRLSCVQIFRQDSVGAALES